MRSSLHLLILCTALLPVAPREAFAQPPAGATPGTEATAPPEGSKTGRRSRAGGADQREPGSPGGTRTRTETPGGSRQATPGLEKGIPRPAPPETGDPEPRPQAGPQSGTPVTGSPAAGAAAEGKAPPSAPTPAPEDSTAPAPGELPVAPGEAGGGAVAPGGPDDSALPGVAPAEVPGVGTDGATPADTETEVPAPAPPAGSPAPPPQGTPATGSTASRRESAARPSGASPNRSESRSGGGEAARRAAPAPITAQAVLATWKNLFERSPLGFDQTTPAQAYQDLTGQVRQLSRSPRIALDALAAAGWGLWLGILALGLLLGGGMLLERSRPPAWRAFWRQAEIRIERLPMGLWLIRLARYVAIPVFILVIWSVGGLFAGTTGPGFTLVQGLLAIWIVYRLLDRLLPAHLELRPESAPDGEAPPEAREEHLAATETSAGAATEEAAVNAERLQRPFHRMLLFTAYWAAGWITMDFLAYRSDVVALWVAAGHLVLVLMAASILLRKRLVLSLLPEYENPAYQRFLRIASALYAPLIYFSILIALLWVVGYRNLAAVFLARSWALVAIWLIGFGLFHSLYRLAERSIAPTPEREEQREQLLGALHRLAGFVVLIFVYAFSLKVLDLWEPWLHLRDQTWIDAGSIRVTGDGIWLSLLLGIFLLLVSRWLQSALSFHVYPRMGIGAGEAYALNRLLHYALLTAIVLLVLNNLGLSASSLALVAGGLSVGLGFGLQNIANNLASGLILLTSRQVRQGDLITIGDHSGVIREVNLRATTITTFDNRDLLIPNAKLLEDPLINWTHGTSVIRSNLPFGIAYSADPDEAAAVALEVARAHPDVLPEPEPDIWFMRMGDNALEFELLVWTDLNTSVRPRVTTQIYLQILRTFRERGIEIPFPQRDLHLRSGVPWDSLIEALGSNGKSADGHKVVAGGNGSAGKEPASGAATPGADFGPPGDGKQGGTNPTGNG